MTNTLILYPKEWLPISPSTLLGSSTEQFRSGFLDPGVTLNSHKNVVATGEGHLFQGLLPVVEAGDPKQSTSRKFLAGRRWSYVRNSYRESFRSRLRRHGSIDRTYWLTTTRSRNYYHWTCEVLPKLVLLKKNDPDATILLPQWVETSSFALSSLCVFDPKQLIFVPVRSAIHVSSLFTLSKPGAPPEVFGQVRDTVRERLAELGGPQRVYISRSDAQMRRVTNEAEVREALEAEGFHCAAVGNLGFAEQVKLMQECRIVISPHGAGLTNLMFMPAHGSVVEIRTGGHPQTYVRLSSTMGHRHYTLPAPRSGRGGHYRADMTVNVELLKQSIAIAEKQQRTTVV
jgi:capsular polysaccharide biosynthesis protein